MKKAMSIALIVEKASADALLRSARNQVDSNAYEVFNTVVELNGRYSSTDASAIGIDRLIIFDSDTTLGTGNLLDTNLQILNMFLGKAEKIESIALVKKTREDRINQYRANVNHPHSLVIPLSDRLEASFLADLLTLSLKDIADTYTDTRITSPTLTSQPISDDRTYSAASAIPGDILSLGAAGSSHADTGFFDDENLTVEDPSYATSTRSAPTRRSSPHRRTQTCRSSAPGPASTPSYPLTASRRPSTALRSRMPTPRAGTPSSTSTSSQVNTQSSRSWRTPTVSQPHAHP